MLSGRMDMVFPRPGRRRAAIVAVVAAGLALAGLAGLAEAAAFSLPADFGANDPRRVLAFGDSITQGDIGDGVADRPYPAVLESLLSTKLPGVVVVNAGRGGEETDGGAARMPTVLAAEHPAFVLIMEGTNDATQQAAHERFDPGAVVANLRAMVQLVKATGSIPILGAIPPNFRPSGFQFADGAREIIAAVNAMLPGVAAQEGIRYVDTFSPLFDEGLYSPDLFHPNQAGYEVLAWAWLPAVVEEIDATDPLGGVVTRASVASDGSEALYPTPGGGAFHPVISADGRIVAFRVNAGNLVPGGTDGRFHVYVHDRQPGSIERVSIASDGTDANADSGGDLALSADGRIVAFSSDASNLVPGDSNGTPDVFVHDRQAGLTERVSVAAGGAQGTGGAVGSREAAISADGRFVAFTSDHPTLGVAGGKLNVFVHDRQTGETTLVSTALGGGGANDDSARPSLSADGRVAVFASRASNLVLSPTTPGRWHVYVHNLDTGATTLLSVAPSGAEGNAHSGFLSSSETADRPVINAGRRFVAFASDASNLVAGDTNALRDVFVHDLALGVTQRVSVGSDGSQASGSPDGEGSWLPSISADGRFVAFTSRATNLARADSNAVRDIFVHDRATGATARVNLARDRWEADSESRRPSLSADGRVIVFDSLATNLVAGDTNGDGTVTGSDVFVAFLRSFGDVSTSHFAWPWIERLVRAGVTAGCATDPPTYCPEAPVTREAMAVFLLNAKGESVPGACVTPPFTDVPCSSAFASWIAALVTRGITAGCGDGHYCPAAPINRAQMAVLVLKTLEGASFVPPACTVPVFVDVPCSNPFAGWIQELALRGITAGCAPGRYCPDGAVTRAQMAVFLVRAFSLSP